MPDALSRTLFLTLANSGVLKRAVSRYGMRSAQSFARRFIAGRDVDEALETARAIERRGFLHTFNHLAANTYGIPRRP